MNLHDLTLLHTTLSAVTLADTFLSLCSIAAWLDPLSLYAEEHFDDRFYEGNRWSNLSLAWEVTRACFPTTYADTTFALRSLDQPEQMAAAICKAINAGLYGGELDDVEYLYYGIPFFGRGLDLTEPHTFTQPGYERLPEVYALLGLVFDPEDTYTLPDNLPEAAYVAAVLALSLRQQEKTIFDDLAWLLDWLFSQTNNTVADYTLEGFEEMGVEFLSWTPDNLAFSNAMHAEADEIITSALRGLPCLLDDPTLKACFLHNVHLVQSEIKDEPHDRQRDAERISQRLRWDASPDPHDADPAPADPENLPLRRADGA